MSNVPQPQGNRVLPTAENLLKGFKDAESPLAVIRANLHQPEGADSIDPQGMANAEAKKRFENAIENNPQVPLPPETSKTEYELNPKRDPPKPSEEPNSAEIPLPKADNKEVPPTPEPKDGFTPTVEEPEDQEVEALTSEKLPPAAENFKKLRTVLKEKSKALKEVTKEKENLAKTVERYETGAALPQVLKEKEDEISRLSHFEKLHSLKTSKEYQDKYVKPLSNLRNKLNQIATDYELPPEELNKALDITNTAELNRFLSSHFDDVGALEVKQVLNQMKELQSGAQQAESEPSKALQDLEQEHQRIEQFRVAERRQKIAGVSRDAWTDSLIQIREEGKIPELIMTESDTEHNEKIARPLLEAAAQQYGQIVRELADAGMEVLPPELARALSHMVLLAHASAVSVPTRDRAVREAEEVRRNADRTSSFWRPTLGRSGGGAPASSPNPNRSTSPEDASAKILQKIGV